MAALAAIEPGYSPARHVGTVLAIGLGVIAWCAATMARPTLAEWAVVPVALLVANVFEWGLHRFVMHVPRPGAGAIYARHTLSHHALFTPDHMTIIEPRQLRWVIMPALAMPGMLLAISPAVALTAWIWSPTAARLLTIVLIAYYLAYEVMHTCYHLPETSRVARIGLVRRLARHHREHHDPRVMAQKNFNITFPIADILFRTYV
jgi:sterol desaturase/sphingolipid hydroxylase (fatty acid hydroxylase superfamily)